MPRLAALPLCTAFASPLLAQTFDVVSVKPHKQEPGPPGLSSDISQRPDGGLTMTNVPAALIIGRAYGIAPVNMAALPGWAMSERFDVSAT